MTSRLSLNFLVLTSSSCAATDSQREILSAFGKSCIKNRRENLEPYSIFGNGSTHGCLRRSDKRP